MIIIRLKPGGKKHQRRFRVVLTEKRRKLTGKVIKILGWYDPQRKEYSLEKEEIKKYLDKGAQVSDTVYNLLVKEGILPGPKRRVHKTKKKESPEKREEQAEEEKKETERGEEGEVKEEKVPEKQSEPEKEKQPEKRE